MKIRDENLPSPFRYGEKGSETFKDKVKVTSKAFIWIIFLQELNQSLDTDAINLRKINTSRVKTRSSITFGGSEDFRETFNSTISFKQNSSKYKYLPEVRIQINQITRSIFLI